MGGLTDEIVLARALLSRVVEPASVAAWLAVEHEGPVGAVRAMRTGAWRAERFRAEAARLAAADPHADLEAAERHGIRLVVPESDEWPHFAFAAFDGPARSRAESWQAGDRRPSESGELVPPLALWARGPLDLSTIGLRSVAIVGARNATEYGTWVARDLAGALTLHRFTVVSGGAHGIDAAAHRGALAARGDTVLVSAGGLDRAYPPGNSELFEQVAERGLLVSESPPGAAPARHRFLTRNRLIAALGTGTVVVEAAARSGATNTAKHTVGLGRPLMAVPGPVTSAASVGCHRLLADEQNPARLVTGADDVLFAVGSASDLALIPLDPARSRGDALADRVDALDPAARQVFDAFPARGSTGPDRLALAAGLPTVQVIRTLPALELAGLIEASAEGYRIRRPDRAARA
ncbi:MAG: processing protein [Pseudonocardiales bacterium]|nr:processing protein [Pseudonocardiales bacterium]MDT4940572.1 processing protein [Pseudonocardiales bacterium]